MLGARHRVGGGITPAVLPHDLDLASLNLREVRDEAEKRAVITVLGRVNGNIVKAAEIWVSAAPLCTT